MAKKRILIIGGVAGGASCAARARRMSEQAEIILFDRGPHVSFANCGLPYYVGDVIKDEKKLLVASRELFDKRFNIDVRTDSDVQQIDLDQRRIKIYDTKNDKTYFESYDALVLATGATPIKPKIPGIDLPGIFALRTIPDSRKIRAAVDNAAHAVIIGAGFVGLELSENLVRRGLSVTIVEKAPQILSGLDAEMTNTLADRLVNEGVQLWLNEEVNEFQTKSSSKIEILLLSDRSITADFVVLGLGVRPDTTLAQTADLKLGQSGGIWVDENMRTSDPYIWAVGDVVECFDTITHQPRLSSLAGPANRQGRIAASAIIRKDIPQSNNSAPVPYNRGTQGTAVCRVFGLTMAMTGLSEKALVHYGIEDYQRIYLHPGNHVSYYPDATPIHMKLLFSKVDGKILGAQALGASGVARRIDVIAMAIQMGATVYDLEQSELCYAPQFGAAKDPVNIAGMIGSNYLRGDVDLADWSAISHSNAIFIDVRTSAEYELKHIPNSVNIPLETLRDRVGEIPTDKDIWLICGVGQRAYYASRVLSQNGFSAKILSGGITTFKGFES